MLIWPVFFLVIVLLKMRVREIMSNQLFLSFISEEWRTELFYQEATAVSPHTSCNFLLTAVPLGKGMALI